MSEKQVGEKLAKHSPRFLWKASADKYGYGTPDRCVLERGQGKVLQIELKHVGGLPKRKSKIKGFKPRQAQWLDEWARNGGLSLLAVGIGDDKVAFFTERFVDMCREGVERDRYDLMNYNQAEEFLLSYGEKTKEHRARQTR